jgi:hypothetical protein
MLRHTSDIKSYAIHAADGQIGSVSDYLFDDETWLVRWLVVDTGHWLPGRKVLLPPSALGHVDHIARQFNVRLTKADVEASPDIATDAPVSRRMETDMYRYYGWSPYWNTGFFMGGYGYAGTGGVPLPMNPSPTGAGDGVIDAPEGDRHLRSIVEVTGYHLHARDGEIGHVVDALVEDGDWSIHYLVADTQNWWPGKKVLISPRSVDSVSWSERLINLGIDRETVKSSPPYDAAATLDRPYETRFHEHYGHLPKAGPVA